MKVTPQCIVLQQIVNFKQPTLIELWALHAQTCMQHNYSIAQITVQFSSYLHGGDNSMELQIWARSHICGTKPVGFQLTRCLLCMMVSCTVDTCAWWYHRVFLNESKFNMTKLLGLAINVMKLEFWKSTDTFDQVLTHAVFTKSKFWIHKHYTSTRATYRMLAETSYVTSILYLAWSPSGSIISFWRQTGCYVETNEQ